MDPAAITVLLIVTLVITLLTGLPVAFSLFGLSILYLIIFSGPASMLVAYNSAFNTVTVDIFIAIPMFILMAAMLESSGIASAMYQTMYQWFGGLKGGLAIGTVVICTIIAAMTGLAATGIVMMGLLAYPEMMKRGYSKDIALGCIPAGGSLGPLIPPSVLMIIIAMLANISVGRMFMGGVMPGLLMSGLFIGYIIIKCIHRPGLAPAIPVEERATWRQKFVSLRGVILPIILIILVLGSIYSGAATPTEAAGVGAIGAVICAAVYRRLNLKSIKKAIFVTTSTTAMVYWLVIGGTAFTALMALTGVRDFMADTMVGLEVAPIVILIIMQVIALVLGCFMDQASISIICIPIFMPIVHELGFDPLWFALLFTVNMIIGCITPPFGAGLFYTKAVVPPDVTMGEIYRSALPYVVLMLIVLVVCFVWPPVLTWLPGMMN